MLLAAAIDSILTISFARVANVLGPAGVSAGAKFDRYGRLVGKVTVGGTDVNLRQLDAGMAWHFKAYTREQSPLDRETYAAAENAAKGALRGLWALPSPTPPWEFRRRGARLRR